MHRGSDTWCVSVTLACPKAESYHSCHRPQSGHSYNVSFPWSVAIANNLTHVAYKRSTWLWYTCTLGMSAMSVPDDYSRRLAKTRYYYFVDNFGNPLVFLHGVWYVKYTQNFTLAVFDWPVPIRSINVCIACVMYTLPCWSLVSGQIFPICAVSNSQPTCTLNSLIILLYQTLLVITCNRWYHSCPMFEYIYWPSLLASMLLVFGLVRRAMLYSQSCKLLIFSL